MRYLALERIFFQSIAIGVGAALGFTGVAFLVFPRSQVVTTFIWPGVLCVSTFGCLLPDSFVYSLDSDGGPIAGLIEACIFALLFWICLFSASFLAYRTLYDARKV